MSWTGTYSHTVAVAFDQLLAAILFNRDAVTVSSVCRLVQLSDAQVDDWPARLSSLNLHPWQLSFTRWLAPILDKLQSSHCELARQGDLARAAAMMRLLGGPPKSH